MSFIVRLYKDFDKRVNSTKVPTNLVGTFTDFNINLKSPTNLFSPVITIDDGSFKDQYDNITNPLTYNYAYIMEFKRYYFIRSWAWHNGIWAADLEVDELASHKTEIGNTSAFVLRAYAESDPDLIDNKYITKSDCHQINKTQSSVWHTNINSSSPTDGYFVLGIVNNDSGAVGATSYYAASGRDTRAFISQLYASPSWMNITDTSISNDLQKMLMNPIQYVVSCMWFPLSLDINTLSTVSNVPVGWWTLSLPSGAYFYKLTGTSLAAIESLTMDIPKHPATTDPNMSWLQNSPYSVYQMQFYPYGLFQLDSAKLYGFDKIYIEQEIDLMTGSGTLQVYRRKSGANYGVIYAATAQVGIPISVAQMSVDMSRVGNMTTWALAAGLAIASDTSAISDVVNGIKTATDLPPVSVSDIEDQTAAIYAAGQALEKASMEVLWNPDAMTTARANFLSASGNAAPALGQRFAPLLQSVGRIVSNIGNAVLASSGVCTMTGNNGALAQYYLDQILTLFYFEISETDPVHYGYPLSKIRTISSLSGFVLCANDGDLSMAGPVSERQAVVYAMTGGFYYE